MPWCLTISSRDDGWSSPEFNSDRGDRGDRTPDTGQPALLTSEMGDAVVEVVESKALAVAR